MQILKVEESFSMTKFVIYFFLFTKLYKTVNYKQNKIVHSFRFIAENKRLIDTWPRKCVQLNIGNTVGRPDFPKLLL